MITLSSDNSLNDLEIKEENERKNAVIEESINRTLLYENENEKKNNQLFSCKWPCNAIQTSVIGITIVAIIVVVLVFTKHISS